MGVRDWFKRVKPDVRPTFTEDDAIRIMRQVGNHALADEMQRGIDRRKFRARTTALPFTDQDVMFMRTLRGADVGNREFVDLPSGLNVTGRELRYWMDVDE